MLVVLIGKWRQKKTARIHILHANIAVCFIKHCLCIKHMLDTIRHHINPLFDLSLHSFEGQVFEGPSQ